MKFKMLFSAVVGAALLLVIAATVPLNNAVLQSDMNGSQKSITNLFGLQVHNLQADNLVVSSTNFGLNITNLPLVTLNNPWDRFPFANTNTGSNDAIRFDNLSAEISASAVSQIQSIYSLVITNGESADTIQTALNGLTNGGTVNFQSGSYSISHSISITNSMLIYGNGAILNYQSGATNFMLDTGTNYGKRLLVQDLVLNGGTLAPFASATYAPGLGGNYNPYLNQFWTNRSGMRVEASGGVVVRGCYFAGWSGNGIMLLNKFGSVSQSYPRAFIINNTFATNFIGCYLPAQNYETPGYYNSDSSQWNLLQPEYSQVIDNQFWANQTAIVPEAGNATVTGNIINSNYVGMFFQPGANEGHGDYSVNNLNHNIYPIYWQGGPGNAGTFNNNMIYQDAAGGVVFSDAVNIQFKHNILQNTPLIFTNGCQGEVAYNTYGQGFGDRWGTDIATNFTGSPLLRVYGNQGSLGTNHDGSIPSIMAFWTNSAVAGALTYSYDAIHSTWTRGMFIETNGSTSFSTNAIPPAPVSGRAIWWFSNYDGWIVTPTKTNRVFQGQ